jgi:hypothetical protein
MPTCDIPFLKRDLPLEMLEDVNRFIRGSLGASDQSCQKDSKKAIHVQTAIAQDNVRFHPCHFGERMTKRC